MFNFLFQIIKFSLLLILPFILLIRGAVYFHTAYAFSPYSAILAGIGITTLSLFIYFTFLYGKISGKFGTSDSLKRRIVIAFLLVFLYSFHCIFFFSSDNMKNVDLKNEMNELHPIVRLSVSTLVFLDNDLIITDANRVPEDYKKMGLKAKSHSLHYQQSTGYAHALDLRTNNRSSFRNTLIEYYFKIMGLRTLRHIGTADHLHISLISHDRPTAI